MFLDELRKDMFRRVMSSVMGLSIAGKADDVFKSYSELWTDDVRTWPEEVISEYFEACDSIEPCGFGLFEVDGVTGIVGDSGLLAGDIPDDWFL